MIMQPEQLTGKTTSHLKETAVGAKNFLVHPDVVDDLLALHQAAQHAGFNLHIASGFRDFARQQTIWNNKMAGKRAILDTNNQPIDHESLSEEEKIFAILRWSALPGASRHHWGCEFDVYDRTALPPSTQLQLEPWEYFTGHQADFYQWLQQHLTEFGFFFPYARDLGGVAVEPWHISHIQTAQQCQQQLTPDLLQQQWFSEHILGKEFILQQLDKIYARYIVNISKGTIR